MSLSLFQLASMVQNNVSGGLRGQQNFTYSIEQLQDELMVERNGLLSDMQRKGLRLPLDECSQRLDALELTVQDYTQLPAGIASLAGLEDLVRRPILHYTAPELVSLTDRDQTLRYVGPISRRSSWDVAWKPSQVEFRKHRRLQSTTPLVYVSGPDRWVFGCPVSQRTVSESGVYSDPRLVGYYPGGHGFTEESSYPMPDFMARDIVQKLTNKYISMYGRLAVRPNDGTAQV